MAEQAALCGRARCELLLWCKPCRPTSRAATQRTNEQLLKCSLVSQGREELQSSELWRSHHATGAASDPCGVLATALVAHAHDQLPLAVL